MKLQVFIFATKANMTFGKERANGACPNVNEVLQSKSFLVVIRKTRSKQLSSAYPCLNPIYTPVCER